MKTNGDTKDIFHKAKHKNGNILYYEFLPFVISVLALFGAFKFFAVLTPIFSSLLKVINNYLKCLHSKKKVCKQPKVKQIVVTCTPIK